MSEQMKHAPGTFCWPELAATNQVEGKKFYTALFGWTVVDHDMGPNGVYTIFQLNGKDVAAAHQMEAGQAAQGIPTHWNPYIAVENADAAAAKAKELGGNVIAGPFDVMENGRMGIIADPTGGMFCIWQGNQTPGVQVLDQPNSLVWNELVSTNADVTVGFYTKLFGWGTQVHDMGPMKYTVLLRGEKPAGGIMQMTEDMGLGKMPSSWLTYFGADDVDQTTAKCKELGGGVHMAPADIPGVGRFSVLNDPQGGVFGLLKFNPR